MKTKWYLANIIVYPVIKHKSKIINKNYCSYWDNLILIKAKNADEAYRKAKKYGKGEENSYINTDGNNVIRKFAGIKDLVEVLNSYLDDEQELTYKQGLKRNFSNIKKMIPPKDSLGLFIYDKYYKKNKIHSDDYMLKHQQRSK